MFGPDSVHMRFSMQNPKRHSHLYPSVSDKIAVSFEVPDRIREHIYWSAYHKLMPALAAGSDMSIPAVSGTDP
ncbi:hypothetical protein BJ1_gp04 [Halorubrum virus BJ1]|uniref:Uncharacterized protein n=1 Tax=Halorubrum virus BJ1 TaxID=416419 RepID=A0ZYL7_9CAUD|nr:hypothetical protein BJ1_gp04 [Halorubrum virus BJ1]CAL92426.1 hypothetical protein [Halorubrum virus BJ1]